MKLKQTLKFYAQAMFSPVMTTVGILCIAGVIALTVGVLSGGMGEDNSYIELVGLCSIFPFALWFLLLAGTMRMRSFAVFFSAAQAKLLHTRIVVLIPDIICILYAILLTAVFTALGKTDMLSDVLILHSVNCLTVTLLVPTRSFWGYIISYWLMLVEFMFLPDISAIAEGFGMTLPVSAAIAGAVFAFGIAAELLLAEITWRHRKKYPPNPAFFGGQIIITPTQNK